MSNDEKTLLFIGLGLAVLYFLSRGGGNAGSLSSEQGVFPTTPPGTLTNALDSAWQSVFPMQLSSAGAAFVKQQEGLRLSSYGDAGGYSIGYGHKITGAESSIIGVNLSAGSTITQAQADALFAADAAAAGQAVNSLVTVPLSQGQFDALVSFVFNEGSGALASSTLLADLNSGNYQQASADFAAWNISGGQVSSGLTARRAAEESLFGATTTAAA